jgi:hypothetical protein
VLLIRIQIRIRHVRTLSRINIIHFIDELVSSVTTFTYKKEKLQYVREE